VGEDSEESRGPQWAVELMINELMLSIIITGKRIPAVKSCRVLKFLSCFSCNWRTNRAGSGDEWVKLKLISVCGKLQLLPTFAATVPCL
jgi:hypothetical protein